MILQAAVLALVSSMSAPPPLTPASVPVAVAGKSHAAVRADILTASEQVCRASQASSPDPYELNDCVSATYESAMGRARQVERDERSLQQSAMLLHR